jgi:hypothetical protein
MGLRAKLLRNPFDSIGAYLEALFWRHLSGSSAEHGNRRHRASQSIDQLPDVTPSERARGNLVEFLGDFLGGCHRGYCSLDNNTRLGAELKSS